MNVPALSRLLGAIAVLLLAPLFAQAAGLTITDSCQSSVSGSAASTSPDPLVSDGSGNVSVTGFSGASYSAGVGQCDPLPADGKPVCTLSASQAKVATGATVTLFAKCTASTGSLTWSVPVGGPAPATNPGTARAVALSFPSPGSYTYNVTGTSTTGVAGVTSAPVTILVGTAGTDTPKCQVSLSPSSILQNGTTNVQIACQPEATSYAWDAADTGAPAPPAPTKASATLGPFASYGVFTYKVAGLNAAGTGPKTAAMVSVTNSMGCNPGPVNYSVAAPPVGAISQDFVTNGGAVIAMSFTLPSGQTSFNMYQDSAYTTYWIPTMQWSISKCPGDFTSSTGQCNTSVGSNGRTTVTTNIAYANSYCYIPPDGATRYLNMRQTGCNPGPGGCGMSIWHSN